jgi:predicted small lipoprotein YifL
LKKLIALTFALILAISLAACGGSGSTITPLANNSAPGSSQGADSSNDMEDLRDALSALDALTPEGWTDGDYDATIYDVWDSSVLPDCVPKEISGVAVGQTNYKSKDKPSLRDMNEVGAMKFENSEYECWGLEFEGTQAQIDEFVKAMSDNGFLGGANGSKYGYNYEWAGNGHYACMLTFGDSDDLSASFQITPAIHKLPSAFFGTKLPQTGIILSPFSSIDNTGYDSDGNEIYDYWNPENDAGTLPEDYITWIGYYGVTLEEAKEYAHSLESAGWEITWEGKYSDNDPDGTSYHAYLQKSENELCVVEFASSDSYVLNVGFANMNESFYG